MPSVTPVLQTRILGSVGDDQLRHSADVWLCRSVGHRLALSAGIGNRAATFGGIGATATRRLSAGVTADRVPSRAP